MKFSQWSWKGATLKNRDNIIATYISQHLFIYLTVQNTQNEPNPTRSGTAESMSQHLFIDSTVQYTQVCQKA